MIENTFGIAASRVRVFHKPIIATVNKVKEITKAVVALHNFLMTENNFNVNYDYCRGTFVDQDVPNSLQLGEWRRDGKNVNGLVPSNNNASNNYSGSAKLVRDGFKEYFNNEGAVDW